MSDIQQILDAVPTSNRVRATAWDAFESAADADDLQRRLDSLPLPQDVKAQLWEAKQQATGLGPPDTSAATAARGVGARFLEPILRAPSDMLQFGAGIVSDPFNNFETTRGVLNASSDKLAQARQAATEGRPLASAGHILGATPIIGPAVANMVETAQQGNVAGAAGQGVVLGAPFAARGVRAGVGRATNAALDAGRRNPTTAGVMDRAADALDAAANERIAKFMAPQTGPNKGRFSNQAMKAAPDVLRDPDMAAHSRGGFARRNTERLDQFTDAMDKASDARLVSQQVKTGPILAALDAEIAKLTARPVEASKVSPRRTNLTSDGAETVLTKHEAQPFGTEQVPQPNESQVATLRRIRSEIAGLGEVAPYEAIRTIRQSWDQVAKVKYMPSSQADALKAQGDATAAMKGTGAMREALAGTDPQSAAAYRGYSLHKAVDDVLAATEEAERVRPNRGRGMMRSLTATQGLPGLVIAIADKAAEMAPTIQVTIARRLAAAADLLRKGQPAQAQAIVNRVVVQFPAVRRGFTATMKAAPTAGRVAELGRVPLAEGEEEADR